MSKLFDPGRFLKDRGINVREEVVHQVLASLLGESRRSIYDLTAGGTRRNGSVRPTPICARETTRKIKRLFDEGRLRPFVDYHLNRLATEGEQPPFPDPSRDAPHQEFLKGLVYGVRLELARLSSFPTVKQLSYRQEDPNSHLQEVRTDGVTQIEWRLPQELNDGWSLVRQHFETGHQDAMEALTRVKGFVLPETFRNRGRVQKGGPR